MKVAWVWFGKKNLIFAVQFVIKKIRYGSKMGKKVGFGTLLPAVSAQPYIAADEPL